MRDSRWHFIPSTPANCVLSLVAGLLLAGVTVWQIVDHGSVTVLPAIVVVVSVVWIALAVVGLVSPRLRGR
ncbi:hypothetical protein GCM10029964_086610 [Kibdelosporangium lantanae]